MQNLSQHPGIQHADLTRTSVRLRGSSAAAKSAVKQQLSLLTAAPVLHTQAAEKLGLPWTLQLCADQCDADEALWHCWHLRMDLAPPANPAVLHSRHHTACSAAAGACAAPAAPLCCQPCKQAGQGSDSYVGGELHTEGPQQQLRF